VVDGFILPERDLLRDKEERKAQVNAKSHPFQNEFYCSCFCVLPCTWVVSANRWDTDRFVIIGALGNHMIAYTQPDVVAAQSVRPPLAP
jgi:hypothetical protein